VLTQQLERGLVVLADHHGPELVDVRQHAVPGDGRRNLSPMSRRPPGVPLYAREAS
jgi:hypothetical protein